MQPSLSSKTLKKYSNCLQFQYIQMHSDHSYYYLIGDVLFLSFSNHLHDGGGGAADGIVLIVIAGSRLSKRLMK